MGEGLLLSERALICLFRRGFVEDYTGAGWEPVKQERMGTTALTLPSQHECLLPCHELQSKARAALWGVERGKGRSRALTVRPPVQVELSQWQRRVLCRRACCVAVRCGAWPSSGSPAAAIDAQIFLGP